MDSTDLSIDAYEGDTDPQSVNSLIEMNIYRQIIRPFRAKLSVSYGVDGYMVMGC